MINLKGNNTTFFSYQFSITVCYELRAVRSRKAQWTWDYFTVDSKPDPKTQETSTAHPSSSAEQSSLKDDNDFSALVYTYMSLHQRIKQLKGTITQSHMHMVHPYATVNTSVYKYYKCNLRGTMNSN
jgi:hypothetical protein